MQSSEILWNFTNAKKYQMFTDSFFASNTNLMVLILLKVSVLSLNSPEAERVTPLEMVVAIPWLSLHTHPRFGLAPG